MAKRPSSKKKGFDAAIEALDGVDINKEVVGLVNEDGTVKINVKELENFKKKLKKGSWRKVRFVALNAPFKRRSPIPPT
jgi:hypothetical protein